MLVYQLLDLYRMLGSCLQNRSMMKSPAVSAASPTQSTAASAPSAMPSPTASAASPRSAMVASQPSSAICSPRTAPPTAKPPTTTAPPATAAALLPVLQPFFFPAGTAAGSGSGLKSPFTSAAGN